MTEQEHLPHWMHPDLWLDENHAIQFHQTSVTDTALGGALWIHRDLRDPTRWCTGAIQWAGTVGPNWTLVSREPLHIEPSVHCLTCGEHGYIRNGAWQSV